MKIGKNQHWSFVVISFLMVTISYASQQQLVQYQWPNGKPTGPNTGQGLPDLIKSTMFAKLDENGNEVVKDEQSLVRQMNSDFRGFMWATIKGDCRRMDTGKQELFDHIIGTLELFSYGNIHSVEGALAEIKYLDDKVMPAVALVTEKLGITYRESRASENGKFLYFEQSWGDNYKRIVKGCYDAQSTQQNDPDLNAEKQLEQLCQQSKQLQQQLKIAEDALKKNKDALKIMTYISRISMAIGIIGWLWIIGTFFKK